MHEAYLRLVGQKEKVDWQSRVQFFAVAAREMRRILIDYARKRSAQKRDGGKRLSLSAIAPRLAEKDVDLLALETALEELGEVSPRKAEVVVLRYYGGLNVRETAQALDVSPSTVDADWRMAKAWLKTRLR